MSGISEVIRLLEDAIDYLQRNNGFMDSEKYKWASVQITEAKNTLGATEIFHRRKISQVFGPEQPRLPFFTQTKTELGEPIAVTDLVEEPAPIDVLADNMQNAAIKAFEGTGVTVEVSAEDSNFRKLSKKGRKAAEKLAQDGITVEFGTAKIESLHTQPVGVK
jgi:hypothetical protein